MASITEKAGTSSGKPGVEALLERFRAIIGLAPPTSHGTATTRFGNNIFVTSPAPSGGFIELQADVAHQVSRQGVLVDAILELKSVLNLQIGEAYQLFDLDKSQASRLRRQHRTLDAAHTAKVLRAMELTALATEVFGSEAAAAQWLKKPHPLLAGESPLQYAVSEFGTGKIKNILVAIRYGGVV
ncbi:MAG: DUF2384 domain-containing protein [Methylococcaceae bacterium]|nr:MAG: DUF2384 domain-containing protein [Methylococcaceae bacterium]